MNIKSRNKTITFFLYRGRNDESINGRVHGKAEQQKVYISKLYYKKKIFNKILLNRNKNKNISKEN